MMFINGSRSSTIGSKQGNPNSSDIDFFSINGSSFISEEFKAIPTHCIFLFVSDAKMVKNPGPGAFQQQSGSEQGSEPKKEQKF